MKLSNIIGVVFRKPSLKSRFALRSDGAIFIAVKTLSRRDKNILILVVIANLILAILDLFGVLLVGIVSSLSITSLSAAPTGNRTNDILQLLELENLNLEMQVAVIGLLASFFLVGKSILSLFLVKRIAFFMARRAAVLSADLVGRYFSISLSKIKERSSQTAIYALTDGVSKIMVGVIALSVNMMSDLVLLFVMGIGLLLIDPIMALSTLLIFGLLSILLYRNMNRTMEYLGERQGVLSIESSERIFEAINTYRELIVRNRRAFYAKKIGELRFELAEGQANLSYMSNISKYILEITLVLSAIVLACYQFSVNTAFGALAVIVVFIAASTRIIPAIFRLQQGFLNMKSNLAGAKITLSAIKDFTNVELSYSEFNELSRNHSDFNASVVVSKINFSYDNIKTALNNIDFYVNPGEFVAIVGGSGAGKTTLVDVIIGALEPSFGSVQISGLTPEAAFKRWPGAVGYVPQETLVINRSIRENLGLGYENNQVTDEYCWSSLRKAHLDHFVRSLPMQLETYVGDRGARISGGQRQRLGIARALITSPKLLILDEATSSLDGITESEISEELRLLKGGVTLIVIAHRLSTILNADRIYFMENGGIKGVGTFSELKENFPEFMAQANLMGL